MYTTPCIYGMIQWSHLEVKSFSSLGKSSYATIRDSLSLISSSFISMIPNYAFKIVGLLRFNRFENETCLKSFWKKKSFLLFEKQTRLWQWRLLVQGSQETKEEERRGIEMASLSGFLLDSRNLVVWITDEMIHRNAFSCVVFAFRIDNGRPVYTERVLATSARSLSCKLIPF